MVRDQDNDGDDVEYPLPLPRYLKDYAFIEGLCSKNEVWFNKRKRHTDRLITSSHVESEQHLENPDNTYVLGIMLQIKMGEKPMNVFNKGSGGNGHTSEKAYDRLVTFADVSTSGVCFGYVFPTKARSTLFFQYGAKQGYGVGTPFLIKEIYHTVTKLGSQPHSMPLMENGSGRAIPLKGTMIRHVPSSELKASDNMNATTYFCYHRVKNLKLTGLEMVRPGCNGVLCDRQVEPTASQYWKCGCFDANGKTVAWVMRMNVRVPSQPKPTTVMHFRSLRTTELFVQQSTLKYWQHSSLKMQDRWRQSVQEVVEYVNNHGGWTMIGWVRTGAKYDDSDPKAKEPVASTDPKPHMTYLMHSNMDILKTTVFKTLRYDIPQNISDDDVSSDCDEESEESDNDYQHVSENV